jgi:hypothetical protein
VGGSGGAESESTERGAGDDVEDVAGARRADGLGYATGSGSKDSEEPLRGAEKTRESVAPAIVLPGWNTM